MKLFQQLLVAPAALGLLAPLAANAAEVNINDVASYATPSAQVTTAQFSDVVPGDWAYTALQNLSESYGCVDNAYTQNLKSGQALTRYEAAALINACLDGGIASADVSADAARLSNEFGTEMAILKGRVDGLEYKVKELSAGQFSSSTKMTGGAVFTTGSIDQGNVTKGKLASEYNFTIDLNTSFNGNDGLYTQLVSSNQNELVLDSQEPATGQNVQVQSLFYTFPIGDVQVSAGPLLDQDDVISATTSIYSDAFRLGSMPWGAAGQTGSGAAASWADADSGFNASVSTVTTNADVATQGIWTAGGVDVLTASVGYDTDNYGGGLIYTDDDTDNSFGAGIYFRPDNFPTISVVYDTLSETAQRDSSNLLIGLDYEVGPGTASAAYQSVDTRGTTTSNYEIYYNYPVSDGIAVQGGVFVEEVADSADRTGVLVETFFSF